jgi:uncharacterized protein (UPF0261 family)
MIAGAEQPSIDTSTGMRMRRMLPIRVPKMLVSTPNSKRPNPYMLRNYPSLPLSVKIGVQYPMSDSLNG